MTEKYIPSPTNTDFLIPSIHVMGAVIDHIDRKNQDVLHIQIGTPYPAEPIHPEVDPLLLEGFGTDRLSLPENFITLGQTLNDACGSGDHNSNATAGKDILKRVARGLARAAAAGYVPRDLTYENVIFSRDEAGIKLLPPLVFEQFDRARYRNIAKRHVQKTLLDSLQSGAETDIQRAFIAGSFGGFINGFEW